MKILQAKAVFGKLRGAELTFGPGLNVITGANESGKSTWAAFLAAMLYGVDTSARKRGDRLPDKTLYAPWNGESMEGRVLLERPEGLLELTRTTRRQGAPLGVLSAADPRTGEERPAPGGAELTGVSREVYTRTAFMGREGLEVTGTPALERALARLVTGEGEDSAAEALARLSRWRGRWDRTGTGRLQRAEQALDELTRQEQRRDALQRRAEELKARASAGEDVSRGLRDLEQELAGTRAGLREARENLAQEEETLAGLEADPLLLRFRGWAPDDLWARAEADAAALGKKTARPLAGGLLTLGGLALMTVSLVLRQGWLAAVGGGLTLWGLTLIFRARGKKAPDLWQTDRPEQIYRTAADYREAFARREEQRLRREQREAEVLRLRQRLEDLRARADGEAQRLGLGPDRTLEDLERLSPWDRELAEVTGALSQFPAPEELEARRDALTGEIRRAKEAVRAIRLAEEALEEARRTLSEQFAPALSARAGEYLAAFTGGKYREFRLSRDLNPQTRAGDQLLHRSTAELSRGTGDQMYLALRLALCDLVLPERPPLVLDDALLTFDQERLAAVLEVLRQKGQTQQILLFTCQDRERRLLAGREDVTLLTLED